MPGIDSFVEYFWAFYGPEGVWPIEGLTLEMAYRACKRTWELDPEWVGCIDSDNRISACVLCCGMFDLPNPYESKN